MPSDLDIAHKLLTPKFRDVSFYVGTWDLTISQDHAEHKYPDRDGALVEATGRAPTTFTFAAIFRNGVADASGESGLADVTQYPDNWRAMVRACADRSTGTLVHPELGPIKVKCKSCKTNFDPMKRDGVDVQLDFVESPEADEELTALLKQSSPMGSATAAARTLDGITGNMSPVPEYPESLSPNALESLKAAAGALAQFKAGLGNIQAGFDSILGGIAEFREQLEITNAESANLAAALRACDAMFSAVAEAATGASSKSVPVTTAIVNDSLSPDAVAGFFGTPLDDFLRMNPSIADRAFVQAGTQVFVFA